MKNSIIILMILFASTLKGNDMTGTWNGTLKVQGTQLRIAFNIEEKEGVLSSTMDSPDQGAFGIATDATTFEDGKLTIKMSSMQIEYIGVWNETAGSIEGTFKQGLMEMSLNLSKKKVKEKAQVKPQISKNSPYRQITKKWNGLIEIQGMSLPVVFNVEEKDGALTATMDSPEQGAFGIPTDAATFEDGKLTIKINSMQIEYSGIWNEATESIEGTFKQGPMEIPLNLSKEKVEKKAQIRPQEPKDFPYQQEEVIFMNPNGKHKLAGTLTIPQDGQFEKVAIFITGSGPQNRDEEILGHRPFLVLSDYLTRNGIATLRYDDRGVGASEGDFSAATSADFATDVSAAMDYLKSRKDMTNKKVVLVGHSEGGMIAPMVATERNDVDLLVSLAGPGISIPELMQLQTTKIAEAEGAPADVVAANAKVLLKIFTYIKSNPYMDNDQLMEKLRSILKYELKNFPDSVQEEINSKEEFFEGQLAQFSTNWFRFFIGFEPATYWKQVTCPVLAVNGELDLQVTSKENLAGIRQALAEGGNKQVTVKEFKGLNHLFQIAKTGATSEYAQIEETFNEEAMAYIANWINRQ